MWAFSRKTGRWTRLADGNGAEAPSQALAAGLAFSPLDGSLLLIGGNRLAGEDAAFWRWTNGRWQIERQVSE